MVLAPYAADIVRGTVPCHAGLRRPSAHLRVGIRSPVGRIRRAVDIELDSSALLARPTDRGDRFGYAFRHNHARNDRDLHGRSRRFGGKRKQRRIDTRPADHRYVRPDGVEAELARIVDILEEILGASAAKKASYQQTDKRPRKPFDRAVLDPQMA